MPSSHSGHPRLLVVGTIGAAISTAANVTIYTIGRAAGVQYVISRTTRVRIPDIVLLSLGSFAIGLAAAAVAVRRGRRGLRALQIVGAVLAVASTAGDFSITGSAAATTTLALMHLVVGLAYITSLDVLLNGRLPGKIASVREEQRADGSRRVPAGVRV